MTLFSPPVTQGNTEKHGDFVFKLYLDLCDTNFYKAVGTLLSVNWKIIVFWNQSNVS